MLNTSSNDTSPETLIKRVEPNTEDMAVPGRQTEENHKSLWNVAREIIEEKVANVVLFACKKCNDKFSNSDNLVNHKQTQHEAPILQCDNCPFKTKSSIAI